MHARERDGPVFAETLTLGQIEIARIRGQNCGERPPQILLLANAEFLDYVLVALGIVSLEVVEQAATLADHHQETAAGGVILLVRFEMIRQFADPLAEHVRVDPEGGPFQLGAQLIEPERDRVR